MTFLSAVVFAAIAAALSQVFFPGSVVAAAIGVAVGVMMGVFEPE